jgi:hypothetical protein
MAAQCRFLTEHVLSQAEGFGMTGWEASRQLTGSDAHHQTFFLATA